MHTILKPELWTKTPIKRNMNGLTGLIEGDDNGYRDVRTLPTNPAPLVGPDVTCLAAYDGWNLKGLQDPKIILPGGLRDGALVVRETFARDIEDAEQVLLRVFGGQYRICALDGFRSWVRQAAGFTSLLVGWMKKFDVDPQKTDDKIVAFLQAGDKADGTFSWVNADVNSPAYETLANELKADARMEEQLLAYAATKQADDPKFDLNKAVYTYITVSANSGIGRAVKHQIPLIFEGNAHAGGGACDIFLINSANRPLNPVPFDFPGPAAAMDYLENETHYDEYIRLLGSDEQLRTYMRTYWDKDASSFTREDWNMFRDALRVLYHLAKAKRWTYYSSDHGGENWHLEGGDIGYDVFTGEVLFSEAGSADKFPDSGNPGHTLQTHGREGIAVWGGASGHMAARQWGLKI